MFGCCCGFCLCVKISCVLWIGFRMLLVCWRRVFFGSCSGFLLSCWVGFGCCGILWVCFGCGWRVCGWWVVGWVWVVWVGCCGGCGWVCCCLGWGRLFWIVCCVWIVCCWSLCVGFWCCCKCCWFGVSGLVCFGRVGVCYCWWWCRRVSWLVVVLRVRFWGLGLLCCCGWGCSWWSCLSCWRGWIWLVLCVGILGLVVYCWFCGCWVWDDLWCYLC